MSQSQNETPPALEDINMTMARIKFPEIAEQLSTFERLTTRQMELADKLETLHAEKDDVDDRVQNVAAEIRVHLNDRELNTTD